MTMTDDDITTTDSLAELAEDQADEVALPGRRAVVTLEGGHVIELRVTNRDYIAWDMTAPKHKWGKAMDVPFLFGTFLAFSAAKREGQTTLTWEQWKAAVIDVVQPEEEIELARPTRPAQRPATS